MLKCGLNQTTGALNEASPPSYSHVQFTWSSSARMSWQCWASLFFFTVFFFWAKIYNALYIFNRKYKNLVDIFYFILGLIKSTLYITIKNDKYQLSNCNNLSVYMYIFDNPDCIKCCCLKDK